MDEYFLLKLIHILSSTLLFGSGLGTAFFAVAAQRNGDLGLIANTWRHVVWADNLFTWPAVLVQPISGYLLLRRLGLPLDTPWILASLWLFVLVGACWLPVLYLQAQMRDVATLAWQQGQPLPARYHQLFRLWFALGWPAFIAVIGIFALMVFKSSLLPA